MKDIFGREIVQQPTGQSVGFIQQGPNMNLVCKPSGQAMGFTQNGGTFDMVGRRLLTTEQPGIFFGGKKK